MNAQWYGVPQSRRRGIVIATLGGKQPRAPAETVSKLLPMRAALDPIGDRAVFPRGFGRAASEPWRLDQPSPTVMTTEVKGTRASAASGGTFHGGPDRVADAVFLALGMRRINEQEAARLQGFPEGHPFQGTSAARYRQIGNAVPPPVGPCGAARGSARDAMTKSLWSIGEEIEAPVRAGPAPRIARVLEVEDTREYEEGPDGRFHPIPGSGNIRQCSRCGRDHEIHATVELSDGTTEVVGVGCARRENMALDAAFRTGEARAKRIRMLTFKLAAERKSLADLTRIAEALRVETNKIGRTIPEPVIEEQPGREAFYDKLYRAWIVTTRFTVTVGERKRWNLIGKWRVNDPARMFTEVDVLVGGAPIMDSWVAWERDQFQSEVVRLQRAWLDARVAEAAKRMGADLRGAHTLQESVRSASDAVAETEALLKKALRAKNV